MHLTELLKKHYLKIIGIVTGGIGGFCYYHFVGCASGTCPITSNPYITTVYGAVVGYLILDILKRQPR